MHRTVPVAVAATATAVEYSQSVDVLLLRMEQNIDRAPEYESIKLHALHRIASNSAASIKKVKYTFGLWL